MLSTRDSVIPTSEVAKENKTGEVCHKFKNQRGKKKESLPPRLGLMRAILLLLTRRVVSRFRYGKFSSFTISLSEISMESYWSCETQKRIPTEQMTQFGHSNFWNSHCYHSHLISQSALYVSVTLKLLQGCTVRISAKFNWHMNLTLCSKHKCIQGMCQGCEQSKTQSAERSKSEGTELHTSVAPRFSTAAILLPVSLSQNFLANHHLHKSSRW
jgi:hypothetical protein